MTQKKTTKTVTVKPYTRNGKPVRGHERTAHVRARETVTKEQYAEKFSQQPPKIQIIDQKKTRQEVLDGDEFELPVGWTPGQYDVKGVDDTQQSGGEPSPASEDSDQGPTITTSDLKNVRTVDDMVRILSRRGFETTGIQCELKAYNRDTRKWTKMIVYNVDCPHALYLMQTNLCRVYPLQIAITPNEIIAIRFLTTGYDSPYSVRTHGPYIYPWKCLYQQYKKSQITTYDLEGWNRITPEWPDDISYPTHVVSGMMKYPCNCALATFSVTPVTESDISRLVDLRALVEFFERMGYMGGVQVGDAYIYHHLTEDSEVLLYEVRDPLCVGNQISNMLTSDVRRYLVGIGGDGIYITYGDWIRESVFDVQTAKIPRDSPTECDLTVLGTLDGCVGDQLRFELSFTPHKSDPGASTNGKLVFPTNLVTEHTYMNDDSTQVSTGQHDVSAIDDIAPPVKRVLFRPESPLTETVAGITSQNNEVRISFTERNDTYRSVVYGHGYRWNNLDRRWVKKVSKYESMVDIVADIGKSLYDAGIAVEVPKAAADKVKSGDIIPEQKRWVSKRVKGTYSGWFVLTWEYGNDEIYQATRAISGSQYDRPVVVVPPQQYQAVVDLAKKYNFKLTDGANEIVRKARSA